MNLNNSQYKLTTWFGNRFYGRVCFYYHRIISDIWCGMTIQILMALNYLMRNPELFV